jgi:hypothetical protein
MEDAAFEARRGIRLKRQRRIKVIGLSLIGLFPLAIIATWLVPVVESAREAARWKRLQNLDYPPPPNAPGVYALKAKPHPSFGGTMLFTPPMPVHLDGGAMQDASFRFEVSDRIDGTVRVDPVKDVLFFFYAPPKTWPSPNGDVVTRTGRLLTLDADGEKFEGGGSTWHDDELAFDVTTEFFLRMSTAKRLTGTIDGRPFTVTPDEQAAFRDFAAYLKPGITVAPPK